MADEPVEEEQINVVAPREQRPSLARLNRREMNNAAIRSFAPKIIFFAGLSVCCFASLYLFPPKGNLNECNKQFQMMELVVGSSLAFISLVMGCVTLLRDRISNDLMTRICLVELFTSSFLFIGIYIWLKILQED